MLRRLACLLLFISAPSLTAAEGAWLEGRWMIVSVAAKPEAGGPGATGGMTMNPKPGTMLIEIKGLVMTTSMRMPPKGELRTFASTIAIEQATADSLTMRVTRPDMNGAPGAVSAMAVRRDGAGLVFTDARSVTTLQPWDEAAVEKQAAADVEDAKPAAAIEDRPLSGTVDGQPWKPIVCRRSHFQSEEGGERIRVNASEENLVGFDPGTKPKLILSLPKTPGDYPLGPNFNLTMFTPPSSNTVLVNGLLRVVTVSDTAIEFSVSARDGDGIEINGTMVADISPLPAP